VTSASEILAELHARGVHIEPRPHGGVRLVPARLIDPDLLNRIYQHKAELLVHLRAEQSGATADEALALLQRLKTFTLPAGRMPAAREVAERCADRLWKDGEPVDQADDLASMLTVLTNIERELITRSLSTRPGFGRFTSK
jgi:hypothetical protein